MTRSKKRIILGFFIFLIVSFFILLNFIELSLGEIFSQKLPKKDDVSTPYSESYLVEDTSYFERQGKNQCAGFTSAYLLRLLGEDITGGEVYDEISHKFFDGYVMPQGITDYFDENNVKSSFYKGTLDTLKARLDGGLPIIALVGRGVHWQHYITIVGYDSENIYIYDTNRDIEGMTQYNRKLSNADFLDIWENDIPFFEFSYFVI